MTRHHHWLGTILAVMIPAAAHAAQSQTEFRDEMIERLSKALGGERVVPVEDDWQQIKVDREGKDRDLTINLGRIWSYCEEATAKDCKATKARFVASSIKEPPPAARKDLRVIVRDASYVAYAQTMGSKEKPATWLIRQIGDDLYGIMAVDGPETIALANGDTLAKPGLSEAEAWAIAGQQTFARLPSLPSPEELARPPAAFADAEYLGSLLLQQDAFAKIAARVGLDLFVTVVSDKFVLVAIMPDGPALERFAATVREDCKAQERCISPHIYRFREGQWRIAEKSGS